MNLVTNLNFQGNCEEAFRFYAEVLKAKFDGLNRYKEMPADPSSPIDPKYAEQLMHASLTKDGKMILMGADVLPMMDPNYSVGNNMEITIMLTDKEETDRVFAAMSAGGKVGMPMEDQFWGDYFGSCKDKYGIGWMILCSKQ